MDMLAAVKELQVKNAILQGDVEALEKDVKKLVKTVEGLSSKPTVEAKKTARNSMEGHEK